MASQTPHLEAVLKVAYPPLGIGHLEHHGFAKRQKRPERLLALHPRQRRTAAFVYLASNYNICGVLHYLGNNRRVQRHHGNGLLLEAGSQRPDQDLHLPKRPLDLGVAAGVAKARVLKTRGWVFPDPLLPEIRWWRVVSWTCRLSRASRNPRRLRL